MAGARTLGEGQGKLAWCWSSPAQGSPRLNLQENKREEAP